MKFKMKPHCSDPKNLISTVIFPLKCKFACGTTSAQERAVIKVLSHYANEALKNPLNRHMFAKGGSAF